ncbi:serine/threonine protein kinase [Luteolibacter pohnpeiensis]|uniref:Serine/threonine protein kinase n=1 Tax=Luteolibacter pohnpeiensis TaxID=454153 RepID=A0A934VVR0_9BACT|nr:serine/threonine-protein kinase [Luteolibacter pohnpeiensis]MBK1883822.1 serine/threonine protein kinase [Luteolibacter pohnpeiensis]
MKPSIDRLLFTAAAGFASQAERKAFLEFACRNDPDRLMRLEELLEVRRDAEDFFEFQPKVQKESDSEDERGLGARIGPYRLIERLGSGGCGVVYLAEQLEPVKRNVALKIIRLGMDTENVIARFNLEREALALMDHPNIARVLDAGTTASGRPYFVMELVDGEKITEFCDRHRLGLRERLEVFRLVCEAIQHAHQKGVVHRDIKPSNVLVRAHERRFEPKVIDFGIAKATAGGIDPAGTATKFGEFIGTPAYVSPEQAEGNVDIDTRSDIYSLGALLCELLTGSPPLPFERFDRRGVEEIRDLLRESSTSAPSMKLLNIPDGEIEEVANSRGVDAQRLKSMLSGDLDWIVMKATEKDRQRRYETADGLAMDVGRYLREEPVLARPPSRRYLLTKWVRRNRVTFAAGSVALFGILSGFGISTWLFVRERQARHEQAKLRIVAEQATANEIRLREDAKVADQVRQAAVLLKYNDVQPADALLDGLPAERVPHSLEAADTFMKVANWNLSQGRWEAAAQRFYALGYVLTNVDMSDSEHISFDLLSVMTAVCEWGSDEQFENLRNLAIIRFSDSANPIVAEQVIKATLLKPATPEILSKIQPLAKILESSIDEKRGPKTPHMVAWRQFSLALLAYRGENLEMAAKLAASSLVMAANSEPRTVSDELILAMVNLRQGRKELAREKIQTLRGEVDEWMQEPFKVTNSDGTLWYNQGAVLILLKEAERMLKNSGG